MRIIETKTLLPLPNIYIYTYTSRKMPTFTIRAVLARPQFTFTPCEKRQNGKNEKGVKRFVSGENMEMMMLVHIVCDILSLMLIQYSIAHINIVSRLSLFFNNTTLCLFFFASFFYHHLHLLLIYSYLFLSHSRLESILWAIPNGLRTCQFQDFSCSRFICCLYCSENLYMPIVVRIGKY